MEKYAPFIRIGIRYVAAMLVAKGYAGADFIADDPDVFAAVMMLAGVAAAGLNEAWYWAARKYGWEK